MSDLISFLRISDVSKKADAYIFESQYDAPHISNPPEIRTGLFSVAMDTSYPLISRV
jgi:hypothetical protein